MAAHPQPLRAEPDKEAAPARTVAPPPAGRGAWLQRVVILLLVLAGGWFAVQEGRDRMLFVEEIDARIVGDLVTVSSRVSGWLTEINVQAGDAISRGQVLARVDARESGLLAPVYRWALRA